MSDHLSTQQLINRIESADRKYRRSSTVLLVVIGIAIALSIFLQYQALEQFKTQSADRAAGLKALQEDNKIESEKTNKYLQCIATYFANPDRANTVIQSIEDCNIDPSTGAFIVTPSPIASNSAGSDRPAFTPGPSNPGPTTTTPSTNPGDPDTSTDPDPDPPLGLVPRLVDFVRGIIGL